MRSGFWLGALYLRGQLHTNETSRFANMGISEGWPAQSKPQTCVHGEGCGWSEGGAGQVAPGAARSPAGAHCWHASRHQALAARLHALPWTGHGILGASAISTPLSYCWLRMVGCPLALCSP